MVVSSWFSPEVLSRGNIVSQHDNFDTDVKRCTIDNIRISKHYVYSIFLTYCLASPPDVSEEGGHELDGEGGVQAAPPHPRHQRGEHGH